MPQKDKVGAQTNKHTEYTPQKEDKQKLRFLSSHSSHIIEPQPWLHYQSPIIIIIIYWPDWNRRYVLWRRTSVLKACASHVEGRRRCCSPCGASCRVRSPCRGRQGREEGERETTCWRFNDNLSSTLERDERKKRNRKRHAAPLVSTAGRRRQPSCSPGRGRPTS